MDSLERTFAEVAEALARPAGRVQEFSSPEEIAKNRESFVRACHRTWQQWHQRAIEQVLVWDEFLRCENTQPVSPGVGQFGRYNSALWRKVNDAIVWSIFGTERWIIKRFCLYRPRGPLIESNPVSALETLATLNANPLGLALWNDATSVLDIGDVTYVPDGMRPDPMFIELKEGQVNAEILDLMELEGAEFDAGFPAFAEKRGKSGVKQFRRVLRQKQTATQVRELLQLQRGMDPATGREIEIVDVGPDAVPYDAGVRQILHRALESGSEVVELVEDCVWVYANGNPGIDHANAVQRFQSVLEERGVPIPSAAAQAVARRDRDRIVPLDWGHYQPLAKPLLLRQFEPEVIGSLIGGRLMYKVFLYLDWSRFANLVTRTGARFAWSSEKEGRRAAAEPEAVRPALFGGRLAQIQVEDVTMYVTDPSLVQLYFDGLPPKALIERSVLSGRRIKSMREESAAGAPLGTKRRGR
jgi:hypothetical protein